METTRMYYALVAGLPDLVLDGAHVNVSFADYISDLYEWIDASDRELVRTMRFPYDNWNVIRTIDKKPWTFDLRGNFTEDELAQEIKSPATLPDYLLFFLEAHAQGKPLFPGLNTEAAIFRSMYEELSEHPNEFVREWFSFDCDLRNVCAAQAMRKFTLEASESSILGSGAVAEALRKSGAQDFGLSDQYPWVEKVVTLDALPWAEKEKKLDELRFDMLDNLTILSGFGIETILAFVEKLAMVERWNLLEKETGKAKLAQLTASLVAGIEEIA